MAAVRAHGDRVRRLVREQRRLRSGRDAHHRVDDLRDLGRIRVRQVEHAHDELVVLGVGRRVVRATTIVLWLRTL